MIDWTCRSADPLLRVFETFLHLNEIKAAPASVRSHTFYGATTYHKSPQEASQKVFGCTADVTGVGVDLWFSFRSCELCSQVMTSFMYTLYLWRFEDPNCFHVQGYVRNIGFVSIPFLIRIRNTACSSPLNIFRKISLLLGHAAAQLVEALRYTPEGRGFDPRWCHWNFSLTYFRPHCGPGVNSASNRNEYQEYFLGGKGGRCVGLTTLSPSCADCLVIWGASTSWSSQGLSRPVMGLLYLSTSLLLGWMSVDRSSRWSTIPSVHSLSIHRSTNPRRTEWRKRHMT